MVYNLTEEEFEKFSNLNKTADQIIFQLGLKDFERFNLYKNLAEIEQTNREYSQELLTKYGEGELNLKEKTFTSKDEK